MKPGSMRKAEGGAVDRSRSLTFRFNGKTYAGFSGDTLASALVANGVHLVARSFRYHRPRGVFSAGPEENQALVCVGEGADREPNVRATLQPLYEGLVANSQRGWPSVNHDVGALLGWATSFLPVGFYYKTFMWPGWKYYERLVRHAAGIAPAPKGRDPGQYDKQHAHCDVLVVGGGPAGLAAALAATRAGLRVILADSQPEPGGSLWWSDEQVDDRSGMVWVRSAVSELRASADMRLLHNTTVVAAWDHGYFHAVQRRAPAAAGHAAQRLWKIRCRHAVLASGAIERPLVFAGNDRPGIMLADAARQYVNRYAALAGHRTVVYTNNDSAYRCALDLQASGMEVAAIVDVREQPDETALQAVRAAGIPVHTNHEVSDTRGYWRLRQVRIRPAGNATSSAQTKRVACDLLCVSGGWEPALHLYSQAGGRLRYDQTLACFLADSKAGRSVSIHPAGSANGCFGLQDCLQDGHRAALAIAQHLGLSDAGSPAPVAGKDRWAYGIQAHWHPSTAGSSRQFVDLLHDVTVESIATAVREGFTSVEHSKRYTTTGMSMDQGKTGNLNAHAILGELTGRTPAEVGTTTFRPPFHPVTLGALAGRETGRRAWPMRLLPLHDWHVQAGGVMEDHSGWYRPAFYARGSASEPAAIRREVLAARNAVALFDSSSLGKIEVQGPDAARFLNRIYINNVESLQPGCIRYGMMLNENGVIMDDGVFARLGPHSFLLSTSSAGISEVLLALEEWLQTEWPELEVIIHNATTQWASFAVMGPRAREVLQRVLPGTPLDANSLPHMAFTSGEHEGVPWRLMRVSFSGELSFELNVPAGYADSVWRNLLEAGAEASITPLGMEALDVLRIEKGYLEVGVDTDVTTSPLDVGWAAAIARKPADFIGRRSLTRPDNLRPDRLQLAGLKPLDAQKFVPVGTHALDREGKPEGHVTSSCLSPTLGCSIALAMLKGGQARTGEIVTLDLDGLRVPAAVVPLTFYDPAGSRLDGCIRRSEETL